MHCEACGFRYEQLPIHDIPRTLRTYPGRYERALRRAVDGGWARRRPAPTVWSPLEYACHVRDVLVVQRERLHLALREDTPTFAPMGREQRVVDDRYNEQDVEVVLDELAIAVEALAVDLEGLDPSAWVRTGVYNHPEPTERSMAWVARHTVHELIHHLGDITGPDPAGTGATDGR